MNASLNAAAPTVAAMTSAHNVRMGEMAVTSDSDGSLTAIGLGSCVGMALVDPSNGIVGMSHVVLPDSQMALGNVVPPAKFADTAVFALVTEMIRTGAHRTSLRAALVGGAMMFGIRSSSKVGLVGPRNVEALTEWLAAFKIPIVATAVGGELGRTIQVFASTGRVIARESGGDTTELYNPSMKTPRLSAVGSPIAVDRIATSRIPDHG